MCTSLESELFAPDILGHQLAGSRIPPAGIASLHRSPTCDLHAGPPGNYICNLLYCRMKQDGRLSLWSPASFLSGCTGGHFHSSRWGFISSTWDISSTWAVSFAMGCNQYGQRWKSGTLVLEHQGNTVLRLQTFSSDGWVAVSDQYWCLSSDIGCNLNYRGWDSSRSPIFRYPICLICGIWCYGWVTTSEKRSKIGDFAPTQSVCSKISGTWGCPPPHQSFLSDS